MKNKIKNIYLIHDIHWDYDYDELFECLCSDNPFMNEDEVEQLAQEIHNDPEKLAEYIECPTTVIVPDYHLANYDGGINDIADYLADTYGFCVNSPIQYDIYKKEKTNA